MCYTLTYSGYSGILITGNLPCIIIKEDHSISRGHKFDNISFVSRTSWGIRPIISVDNIKNVEVYILDSDNISYENKLPLRKIEINSTLNNYMTLTNITYHAKCETLCYLILNKLYIFSKGGDKEKISVGTINDVPHVKVSRNGIILVRTDYTLTYVISHYTRAKKFSC